MTLSHSDINTIKDYFRNKPVLKAFLFGSYSHEEADSENDIDIIESYTLNTGYKNFLIVR